MKILGFMGSPRVKGLNAQLIDSALGGARRGGAETKRYDIIQYTIKYCRGCFRCVFEHHELPIGKCTLQDDMAAILEDYLGADGYIFAVPVYDVAITALMKTFIERKFPLFYKNREDTYGIPAARNPARFLKKASIIVTANARDQYREVMGTPCFEAIEYDFMLEQVETVDKLYVGGAASMTAEKLSQKREETFSLGLRLVEAIEKAQRM